MRALLAAIGIAIAAAPLGCFIVWRRMAYFGDATAHAGILGIALALALSLPLMPGVLLAALVMSAAVSALSARGLAEDTALGVLAHGALAVGLVAVSLIPGVRVDLTAYLLGDILAVSPGDLGVIWMGAACVVLALVWKWNALLLSTLDPDLARAAGVDDKVTNTVLTLGLAVTVAVAIKIVGVLLVAALLIVPAATARGLARSPEGMAVWASALGVAAACTGIATSWQFDTPTGPSIVAVATLFFTLSLLAPSRR